MLLADPALRRPHLAARQEQDVEARVHPQHAQRRRRRCKQNLYTSLPLAEHNSINGNRI